MLSGCAEMPAVTAPAGAPAAEPAPYGAPQHQTSASSTRLPAEPATAQPVVPSDTPAQPRPLPLLEPVRSLLAYTDRLRAMSGTELSTEITRLGEPGEVLMTQMQLALALLQTHLPSDTARAQALLQKAVAGSGGETPSLQAFARLLVARTAEQRRLEDTVDRQNQQLRDSQRRIDQLNERLEAMRAIERSLTSRPGAPQTRPAAPSH